MVQRDDASEPCAHPHLVRPRRHHRAVVHAVNDHLVDPFELEKVLLLKIPGDLGR